MSVRFTLPSVPLRRRRRRFSGFGWTLAVLLSLSPMIAAPAAEDATELFEAANKQYEQGNFAGAIEAYEALLDQGLSAANVFFNLGNAHFQQGDLGRAIAAYQRAQRLAPRNSDIRTNLSLAREQVPFPPPQAAVSRRGWLQTLTLGELMVATTVLMWLFFGLLAARQLRPDRMERWRSAIRVLGVAWLVAELWLAGTFFAEAGRIEAVVVENEAPVRYGPLEESQTYYVARDGTELRVLDEKDSWLQVADSQERTGWIQSAKVEVIRF